MNNNVFSNRSIPRVGTLRYFNGPRAPRYSGASLVTQILYFHISCSVGNNSYLLQFSGKYITEICILYAFLIISQNQA